MFSFWKRKPRAERQEDVIWRDLPLRDRGAIQAAAVRLRERGGAVALLAHFPADLRRLGALLRADGSAFADLSERAERSAGLPRATRLVLAPADALGTLAFPGEPGLEVSLLVVGRHPLLSRDEAVEAAADECAAQGGRVHLGRHVSLEDPLLRVFRADRVMALLDQLGMGDSISHPLVSRSLRSAQERLEAKATGDLPADSAQEWIAYNCPGLDSASR